jgi:uncharacterized delta-60 repeat protein
LALVFFEFTVAIAENKEVRKFLTVLLGVSLLLSHSAFAFLGMNAGATLQGPLPAWTKQLGSQTSRVDTEARAVATDASGNIVVAGYTRGGLDGNTLVGTQDFFVTKYNSSGTKLWTRQLGPPSQDAYGYGAATDASGNIIVVGSTWGGLDGNTLTGSTDFFVTKYDSTGAKLWTRQLGVASYYTEAHAVATDSSGNIFVAGFTSGALDGNTLTGAEDFFLTKYDSTGTKVWTRQLGADLSLTRAYGVATDSSGNIFVAGSTGGELDGNSLTGTEDFFLTKYNSAGTKVWTKQLGTASIYTKAYAVATDSSGNIFVAGFTGGGLDGNTLTGTEDLFLTKYNSTGTKVWTKQLGVASKLTEGFGVATDSSGNIFVAGYTSGGLDGNSLTGVYDFFATKYDPTGAKLWTKQMGATSQQTEGVAVATDASGNVFVAGYTDGGLDGNSLTGSEDLFVTKYDSTSTKAWTKQLGTLGPSNVEANAATVDGSGNLYIAGDTTGGLDGNTQTGTNDFFVTKYNTTGTKLWTRQLGVAAAFTSAYGVATDSSENIYVAGQTQDGLDGNSLTGYGDFFVTKYDSAGTKQWTRQLGVASHSANAYAAATDSSGNVYVAGDTDGGLDGNSRTGDTDFFVTKYDSSGTKQWTKQLGVASQETHAFGVATDSSGNVVVAGITTGGLDGNSLTGDTDFFVTKYNSAGTKLWTKQLGVASQDTYANAVSIDSSGNIFVTGGTYGGLDGNTLKGTQDVFVTKYDSTGTKLWTRQLGVSSQDTAGYAVTADLFGNVFITGTTDGGLDGNALTGTLDFFVTKYTSTGVKQWTKQMGSPSKDSYSTGIAIHSSGRLYVAGGTNGGLDFNSRVGDYDAFACQYIGN